MTPANHSHTWDYLGFDTFSGEYNMSLDRQLLHEFRDGQRTNPALRFYQWQKPTVSLGKNQVADDVILKAKLEELDYDLVTRPTGGRALLHKGDICYALAGTRNSHPQFRTLSATYRAVGIALAKMIQSFDISLVSSPARPDAPHGTLNPCFAMLSPFEVTVRGRKICGSAQFRSGESFLQHGSIRVRDNWSPDDLVSIWPEGAGLAAGKITCLDSETGTLIDSATVAEHLKSAFASCFEVEINP